MKPSLTPRTILLTSARLSPCRALACASSPLRLTTTLPSATFKLVRCGSSQSSLPLGPSTKTRWPFTSIFTLAGMAIGCFPIRDISLLLPNVAKQFPANILFTRLHSGHHALGRGDDSNAHTPSNAWDVCGADVTAQTRRTDALQTFNDALLALVLQSHLNVLRQLAFD